METTANLAGEHDGAGMARGVAEAILPLVGTAVTVGVTALLYPRGPGSGKYLLAELDGYSPRPITSIASHVVTYAHRGVWVGANSLLAVACVAVVALAVWLLASELRLASRRRKLGVLLLSVAVLAAALLLHQINPPTPQLARALEILCGGSFRDSFIWSEALAFGIAVLLSCVSAAILLPRQAIDAPERIAEQMWELRGVLYAGSLLLVSEMVQASALAEWMVRTAFPMGRPTGTEVSTYAAVESLATSFVVLRGLYSTMLLLSIYVPAALVLMWRARRLVTGRPDEESG